MEKVLLKGLILKEQKRAGSKPNIHYNKDCDKATIDIRVIPIAVETKHPLQQGLRLFRVNRVSTRIVETKHPLQQGLRQFFQNKE